LPGRAATSVPRRAGDGDLVAGEDVQAPRLVGDDRVAARGAGREVGAARAAVAEGPVEAAVGVEACDVDVDVAAVGGRRRRRGLGRPRDDDLPVRLDADAARDLDGAGGRGAGRRRGEGTGHDVHRGDAVAVEGRVEVPVDVDARERHRVVRPAGVDEPDGVRPTAGGRRHAEEAILHRRLERRDRDAAEAEAVDGVQARRAGAVRAGPE
jgi:hypothetical protein